MTYYTSVNSRWMLTGTVPVKGIVAAFTVAQSGASHFCLKSDKGRGGQHMYQTTSRRRTNGRKKELPMKGTPDLETFAVIFHAIGLPAIASRSMPGWSYQTLPIILPLQSLPMRVMFHRPKVTMQGCNPYLKNTWLICRLHNIGTKGMCVLSLDLFCYVRYPFLVLRSIKAVLAPTSIRTIRLRVEALTIATVRSKKKRIKRD